MSVDAACALLESEIAVRVAPGPASSPDTRQRRLTRRPCIIAVVDHISRFGGC